jgi:acetyl esterase
MAIKQSLIDEPGFAAQTDEFLARMAAMAEMAAKSGQATPPAASGHPPDPAVSGLADPQVRVADLYLPGRGGPVLTRVYQAADALGRRPVLLWLHGGGFVAGSVYDLDHVCSRIARLGQVTVASLEYRLAPAHPFPAALHDTYDALCWLAEHGAVLGGDGLLAAGGQSAGAALAAGATLMARDAGGPVLTRQVLCYPALDFGQNTESVRLFNGVFLTIEPGGLVEQLYLRGQEPTVYAAPLRAESLAGLPPALVVGAGRDPLRDDARAYVRRLDSDGVDVTHVEYAGTMHGFLNFCGVLSAGDHAIDVIASDLRRAHSDDIQQPLRVPSPYDREAGSSLHPAG